MYGDCKFVEVMKKFLNSAILFEREYNQNLVAARIVDIVKGLMGSDFLIGISGQFYYG